MMETLLTAGIVVLAGSYLARYLYRFVRGKTVCHCGIRQSECPVTDVCAASQSKATCSNSRQVDAPQASSENMRQFKHVESTPWM